MGDPVPMGIVWGTWTQGLAWGKPPYLPWFCCPPVNSKCYPNAFPPSLNSDPWALPSQRPMIALIFEEKRSPLFPSFLAEIWHRYRSTCFPNYRALTLPNIILIAQWGLLIPGHFQMRQKRMSTFTIINPSTAQQREIPLPSISRIFTRIFVYVFLNKNTNGPKLWSVD